MDYRGSEHGGRAPIIRSHSSCSPLLLFSAPLLCRSTGALRCVCVSLCPPPCSFTVKLWSSDGVITNQIIHSPVTAAAPTTIVVEPGLRVQPTNSSNTFYKGQTCRPQAQTLSTTAVIAMHDSAWARWVR